MNTGEYYTRDINYKNWGYDDYYSLIDDGNYEDASYQLDRELILNEFFYEKNLSLRAVKRKFNISHGKHFKQSPADAGICYQKTCTIC